MPTKKSGKKIPSVKEAFKAQCVTVEVIKAFGYHKVGDELEMHKSTAAPLKKKKLVK